MSIRIPIDLEYEFEVRATYKSVWAVLSDVLKSAQFFPKVEQVKDLGGNAYEWQMTKIGVADAYFQTVFASHYEMDAKRGLITWTALEGVGNAAINGSWALKANQTRGKQSSTWIFFQLQGIADVPLPHWLEGLARPLLNTEFEQLTDGYIHQLIEHFGGEV